MNKPTVDQLAWAIKKANDNVKRIEPKYNRAVGVLSYYMEQMQKFYPEELARIAKLERDKDTLSEKINAEVEEKNRGKNA